MRVLEALSDTLGLLSHRRKRALPEAVAEPDIGRPVGNA
jgi:hypothetical protein